MVRLLFLFSVLFLALPAEAQMRRPGADFIPDPGWSENFTKGMQAIYQKDFDAAERHFSACVEQAGEKPDANCEFYLSLMYHAKGDIANWRKWLYTSAAHGHPQASVTVDLMERYK